MLRALERGGMSDIWLAEQIALARPVAIKLLTPGEDFEVRVARFRQEAATIARFDHPNVVGIIEFGQTADGRLFYSMPYVPNGSLIEADLIGDSARLRTVLSELLQALAYVHRQGVVHRDVKPENVLFDSVGRARLADFGVSRIMTDISRQTRAGETFGSSYYMSPEQARGELPDGRSDLYSVGVLTYELLTGEPPFQGPDHLSIVIAHLQNPVPRLPESCRQWQGFVDTAMAKRPEKRFPDAEAMLHALHRIPEHPGEIMRLRRLVRQPAFAVGAMVATVLAGLLTIAAFGLRSGSGDTVSVMTGSQQPRAGLPEFTPPVDLVYDEELGAVVERTGGAASAPASRAVREFVQATPGPHRDRQSSVVAAETVAAIEHDEESGSEADDSGPSPPGGTTSAAMESVSGPGRLPGGSDDRAMLRELLSSAIAASEAQAAARTSSARSPRTAAAPTPVRTLASTIPNPGNFAEVPGVPLLILGGDRDERLARLDALLELGRRNIESERTRTQAARSSVGSRAERRQLDAELGRRQRNYETWRGQVLALRDRAQAE